MVASESPGLGPDAPSAEAPRLRTTPGGKKRRRPALACEHCRARKVRCDRTSPCGTCVRTSTACTYLSVPAAPRNLNLSNFGQKPLAVPQPSTLHGQRPLPEHSNQHNDTPSTRSTAPSNEASVAGNFGHLSPISHTPNTAYSSSADIPLSQRVSQLERELSHLKSKSPGIALPVNISSKPSSQNPSPHTETDAKTLPVRGSASKTRLLGQSHFRNFGGLSHDYLSNVPRPPSCWERTNFVELLRLVEHDETTELYRLNRRCKNLSRIIKAARFSSQQSTHIGQQIPQRPVADELMQHYLSTFETVYRVVHVPSFMAEYRRHWDSPSTTNRAFIVLMQLCMAVGTCFYDDRFTLRPLATRWVYEAQLRLIAPPEKAKLTICGLQIQCLLHFARQTAGVTADLTWVSAGSLLRTAICMGLHRDPQHMARKTAFGSEMRRRLWATILEIVLQSSINAGGPPLLSLANFDTESPANLDDSQISPDDGETSVAAAASNVFTQTAVQIELFKSFPIRLAIATALNDIQPYTPYEETLRLNGELASAYQSSSHLFSASKKDGDGMTRASGFQFRMLEMIFHHFFLALHSPFLPASLQSNTFYFSRKMCTDASLKLCKLVKAAQADATTESCNDSRSSSATDFSRLSICGAGPFRSTFLQSFFTAGLELLLRKEEEKRSNGLSRTFGETEIRDTVQDGIDWAVRRLGAGEVNIKTYLYTRAVIAQVDAINDGLGSDEVMEAAIAQMTDCANECVQILKGKAGDLGQLNEDDMEEGSGEGSGEGSFEIYDGDPMDIFPDWGSEYINAGFSANLNFSSLDAVIGPLT